MTSDVSARHVVCHAGSTKVRKKLKKGSSPMYYLQLPSHSYHFMRTLLIFKITQFLR